MKNFICTVLGVLLIATSTYGQVINHWRGPDRNGIYPEKNLLNEWPADGPEILWVNEQLGFGYSSPTFANGKIYLTGMEDGKGYIYILSQEGQLVKKYSYGPERDARFPGSRTSPMVADNMFYMVSAYGRLICLDLTDGSIVWTKELFEDFDGENIRWGYTENLIVDGDRIYSTPGGGKYNVVALNRFNGNIIWTTPAKGGLSAYCSPILVNHNNRSIFITMMAENVIGVDTETGKLLWNYPYKNQRSIHPNSPLYHNGYVFCFSGYGYGGLKLRISPDGNSVSKEWFNSSMDNQMGGAILHNGYLYGSGDRNRYWYCVDWETGEDMWQSRDLAKGTVIMADGMLYKYTDRGELALVEPSPEGLIIKGQTTVKHGSEQHWAHLVISDGVLYVRRGEAIIAYSVK